MSHFSDYYVVYQRVGEHAMVLVGHENDGPRASSRLMTSRKTPTAGFTLQMALGMKSEVMGYTIRYVTYICPAER